MTLIKRLAPPCVGARASRRSGGPIAAMVGDDRLNRDLPPGGGSSAQELDFLHMLRIGNAEQVWFSRSLLQVDERDHRWRDANHYCGSLARREDHLLVIVLLYQAVDR